MANTDESLSSGQRGDAHTRPPLVDGKEGLPPGEGNERVHLAESESSAWREGERRRRLVASGERGFSPGIGTAHRHIRKAKASSRRRTLTSLQRSRVAEESLAGDRTVEPPHSTASQVDQWETAGSSIGQAVSENTSR